MTSLRPPSPKYPLSVMLTSSGTEAVSPDSLFELGVTVNNIGDRSAIIYVFIEERTPALRQWCRSMQERLALAPNQSGEVTFQIEIPATALPEVLEYDIVIDGSDSYQDFPPKRYERYQLQVLPAARAIGGADEPTFYLDPISSSRQPLLLQSGVSQLLQIWVDNRAERVDRFRLSCTGLPTDWLIEITYPNDTQEYGLVIEADSLGLNPGDRGQILATITPPLHALAGIYVPTLRVLSENQPDMNLLDLVYFQVNPTYQLQPLLQILRSQVRHQPALFEIRLENLGNTPRTLNLAVDNLDDPDSCTYTLEATEIAIAPLNTQRVFLEAEPQKWWQRPLYGGGRFFNFRVLVKDSENHPVAAETLPANFLWLPRPWWQLLLLILSVLGLAAAFIWLLWWLFFRPPALPEILAFEAGDSRYAEANGEVARVSWDVQHSHQIEALELTGLSPDGEIISSPLIFTFNQGILPQALHPFCTQQAQRLICTQVRTNARQPGTYRFELTLRPRGTQSRQPIVAQSSNVTIEPLPIVTATITDFAPSRLQYQEAGPGDRPAFDDAGIVIGAEGIQLNWVVMNPQALTELNLTARNGEEALLGEIPFEFEPSPGEEILLPASLASFCEVDAQALVCLDVPTQLTQVGTYTFELTAISRESAVTEMEPAVVQTEPVTIHPLTPVIQQFQINGAPVQPKYLIPVERGAPPPVITLSWNIIGGQTTAVELLPVPGPVSPQGETTLPLNPTGSALITLQASNPSGDTVARTVQIETFDPNPQDPAAAAAAAAAAAVAGGNGDEDADRGSPLSGAPANRDGLGQERIAPSDSPPQFD